MLSLFVLSLLVPFVHAQDFNISYINDATSSLEIRDFIEINLSSNLSMGDYNALIDQRKNAVANDLLDNRPYDNLTHFSDIFSRVTYLRNKIQIAFDAANSSSLVDNDFSGFPPRRIYNVFDALVQLPDGFIVSGNITSNSDSQAVLNFYTSSSLEQFKRQDMADFINSNSPYNSFTEVLQMLELRDQIIEEVNNLSTPLELRNYFESSDFFDTDSSNYAAIRSEVSEEYSTRSIAIASYVLQKKDLLNGFKSVNQIIDAFEEGLSFEFEKNMVRLDYNDENNRGFTSSNALSLRNTFYNYINNLSLGTSTKYSEFINSLDEFLELSSFKQEQVRELVYNTTLTRIYDELFESLYKKSSIAKDSVEVSNTLINPLNFSFEKNVIIGNQTNLSFTIENTGANNFSGNLTYFIADSEAINYSLYLEKGSNKSFEIQRDVLAPNGTFYHGLRFEDSIIFNETLRVLSPAIISLVSFDSVKVGLLDSDITLNLTFENTGEVDGFYNFSYYLNNTKIFTDEIAVQNLSNYNYVRDVSFSNISEGIYNHSIVFEGSTLISSYLALYENNTQSFDACDFSNLIDPLNYYLDLQEDVEIIMCTDDLSNILNDNLFEGNLSNTTNVLLTKPLDVKDSSSNNFVILTKDTLINSSSVFNLSSLEFTNKNASSFSVSNITPKRVVSFGIENITLEFNNSITIRLSTSSSLNGETLEVRRSIDGVNWTTTGLIDTTCVVSSSICEFRTNKASYFAVYLQPSTSSGGSGGGSSGGSGGGFLGGSSSIQIVNQSDSSDNETVQTSSGSTQSTSPIEVNETISQEPIFEEEVQEDPVPGTALTGQFLANVPESTRAIILLIIIFGLAGLIVYLAKRSKKGKVKGKK